MTENKEQKNTPPKRKQRKKPTRKLCRGCDEIKEIKHFYKGGRGANSFQSRCIICHKNYTEERRQKFLKLEDEERKTQGRPSRKEELKEKRNGFKKLPKESQEYILKYFGAVPLTRIARHLNLNISTLHGWKRRGLICQEG